MNTTQNVDEVAAVIRFFCRFFAPTTLAPARDFWTLRYTTSLENGSLVECERSLLGSGAGPNPAAATQFV
ncbi:putative START domain-containing protein [Helianthus anomalus]